MTAKEYLSEIQLMKINIEQLQEQKQMYLDMATSITAPINSVRVQTTRNTDRMGDNVTKVADISKKIDEDIAALLLKQDMIIKQIRGLHNYEYIQVLFKVYVQFKSLKVTSQEMKRSYNFVLDMHKKALAEFEEKYSEIFTSL